MVLDCWLFWLSSAGLGCFEAVYFRLWLLNSCFMSFFLNAQGGGRFFFFFFVVSGYE